MFIQLLLHMQIGFIGQGFIGKNYADDFVERGYEVVRYGLEEEYAKNKDKIALCDVVFIAVPTPTTKGRFDDSIVRSAVRLVGKGNIAVIKSTMLPGTTLSIQEENPDIFVFHSPEFLSEKTAAEDARHPRRNIIGIPKDTDIYKKRAKKVLDTLPSAPYELICSSSEAEIMKYANNTFFYTKVVFMNLLHDLSVAHACDWSNIREAMAHEPWIGDMHIDPVHKTGRGAGGPCLIKDFAAFARHYHEVVGDLDGNMMIDAIERKNLSLLKHTNKDTGTINEVYGESYHAPSYMYTSS